MSIEPATTQQLAAALTERGNDSLAALMAARPDLANPAPSSMTALAARAASRPSVERALREMNAAELAAARALTEGVSLNGAPAGNAGARDASTSAPGAGDLAKRLTDLALAVDGRPVAGLVEATQTPASPPEVLTGEPPATAYRSITTEQATDEGVRAAADTVRLVAALLEFWEEEGASILRTGGVGVREVRRTAAALGVSEPHCAFIVELAATAGLLGQDDEPVAWVPARPSRGWLDDPLPERWAALASSWPDSPRVAWLAGTREDGAMRAALQPELERAWAVTLRRRVMDLLGALPEGAAPDAETVHALLAWERPRATPAEPHVRAVLEEAARLGITGSGALTPLGRALRSEHEEPAARERELIAALQSALPEPVDELLIQSDLTGIVPGWPSPELGAILERCSEVESRGSALTVRFTPASIRAGLDAGMDADGLVSTLKQYSRTPIPQALEYLVHDTARRHGQVRVGTARSYLLAADASTADQLLADPALRSLKLRRMGEQVVLSPAEPTQVLTALRAAGLAPVAEGNDGEVMAVTQRRRVLPPAARPGASSGTYSRRLNTQELTAIAARARAGEEQRHRDIARRTETGPLVTDPVHALEVLRAAAASGDVVELVMAGSLGRSERRRVRPLSVEGGRVRVADVEREVELVVAVHRISEVIAEE
ncbi:helicase-associated domain-containing protein [Bogoriella caseilytica]|uniref:XPB/Ssl2-like helicase family protein n=1 Tax=Bogoriella caseilytica TaxID=56055 RepID=A0A3N2BDJ6_9MICO|nr:helicase-associated domain-containing protein [Bogoriella caseilytica]ROR73327.1 XPB/Ssl2-like helicase family protein [Bogoriella caseilytica]